MTTTSAHHVTCTVDDEGIARVWLDRPDKLNGLTLPMLRELAATGRRLTKDRSLRAVILTGANHDGAKGLQAVAEAGGIALVQDPSSATASAMPEAAIRMCPSARVMPLEAIAEYLKEV